MKKVIRFDHNYVRVSDLNKMEIGNVLEAKISTVEVKTKKNKENVEMVTEAVIEMKKLPFQIRRVLGGFMYEYETGHVAFVSTDEFRNE